MRCLTGQTAPEGEALAAPCKHDQQYDIGLDEMTIYVRSHAGQPLGTACIPLALLVQGLQHDICIEVPRIGEVRVSLRATDFGIPLVYSPASQLAAEVREQLSV